SPRETASSNIKSRVDASLTNESYGKASSAWNDGPSAGSSRWDLNRAAMKHIRLAIWHWYWAPVILLASVGQLKGTHDATFDHMGYHAQTPRPAEAPPSKATGEKGGTRGRRADRSD